MKTVLGLAGIAFLALLAGVAGARSWADLQAYQGRSFMATWDKRADRPAAAEWALAQTRLAPTDRSDARIPFGGTPGFAVLDLRAGLRVANHFVVAAVLENVFDAAYRYHGSSINGPGRSVIVSVESGF